MGLLTSVSTIISLALILTMVVMDSYNRTSFQTMQEARMRSHFNTLESQIRLILLDPNSYICNAQGGIANCRLTLASDFPTATGNSAPLAATDKIQALFSDQPQGICRMSYTSCKLGLAADPVLKYSADGTRPSVQLDIMMVGNDAFPKVRIEVNPTPEIFQSRSFLCEGFLTGFNPDGSPICQSISRSRAPAGSYVSAVDMTTLQPSFSELPSDITDCANDTQFLQSYEWKGGTNYTATCSARLNPFLFGGG